MVCVIRNLQNIANVAFFVWKDKKKLKKEKNFEPVTV